jgi:hypothetical protein
LKELSKVKIKKYQEEIKNQENNNNINNINNNNNIVNNNNGLFQTFVNSISDLMDSIVKYIKPTDYENISEIMDEIIKQSYNQKLTGIGYDVDKEMKTNEQVFSIFGKLIKN